jgi:CDP-glucose 4,6-dehydratase
MKISHDWMNTPVLITGHTGFKGSWLSLWLNSLGAKVHGYALNPPTVPSLFEVASVAKEIESDTRANLSDLATLRQTIKIAQPEVVFHLAAQPLVRDSYVDPLGTFATNVMGTANLLEAIRGVNSIKAVVIVTTDKVYENREWVYPYREVDPLGGHDPYSASKAAAEIVVASYRASFFSPAARTSAQIATARAGNVIGGGDWAQDRLVPDCLHAFAQGEPVRLRYPAAIRPWQHVLEPIAGYVCLAEKLLSVNAHHYACAWNFGPEASGDATVGRVARLTAELWGNNARVEVDQSDDSPHEAGLLRLDITRARSQLGWQPCWSIEQALQATVDWHRAWLKHRDMRDYTLSQICDFRAVQPSESSI